jgi:ABC-type branched-subunit amino acid transport system substrate-binding protein
MRTKFRAKRWHGALLATGAIALAGCGGDSEEPAADGGGDKSPVKIGAFVYTQGTLKAFGDETLGGVKLAVEQINENGGILGGRKVELKVYEEGLDASTTQQSIRRAKSDGVHGIVGFLDATAATSAASLTDRLELPLVIAGAGSGTFIKDNKRKDLAHVLTYPEAMYPGVDAWIKSTGAKKVAHIGYDSVAIRITEKVHRENLSDLDFPPTIYVPYGQADISEAVAKAVAGKPDVILFDIWGNATVGGIKRMAELGFKGHAIQSTVSMVDQYMEAAGDSACGLTFMDSEYFSPSEDVPESQQFVEDLKAAGYTLGGQTEPFYEGTKLLLDAMDKAGSTDDREAIGEAMQSADFMTPRGAPIEVLPNGQVYVPSWDLVKWNCDTGKREVMEKLPLDKSLYDDSKIQAAAK